MHEIKTLNAKELRSFGLSTGAILVVLFGLLLPWLFNFALPVWPWIVGGVLAAWAFIAPATLNSVYKIWMRFGLVMNKITTPIILGLVYYVVVTPMGLGMRLFRRDPMNRAFDPTVDSYKATSRTPDTKHFERPF